MVAPDREGHHQGTVVVDGQPGWQSDGSYLTPEHYRLKGEVELASYLRTVQDWIIRPQLRSVAGIAGIDSIGGYEKQYVVEPNAVHMAVTRPQTRPGVVETFEADLADAVPYAVAQAAAGAEALSSALYGGVAGGLTDEVADFVTMVMSDMLDTQQSLPPEAP